MQATTVKQFSKLKGLNGLMYYVVLPNEAIIIDNEATLQVRQGVMSSYTVHTTGEDYEAIRLNCNDGIVDAGSIALFDGPKPLSIAYDVVSDADAVLQVAIDGTVELVLTGKWPSGHSLSLQYATCAGIAGNNIEIDQLLESEIANVVAYIAEPILGGTDLEALDAMLSNAIVTSGRNNLIGSEQSVVEFLHRTTEYRALPRRLSNGVLRLLVYRDMTKLLKQVTYLTACGMLQVRQDVADALANKVNNLEQLSLSMLVDVKPAKIERCALQVKAAGQISKAELLQAVIKSLAEQHGDNTYSTTRLHRDIAMLPGLTDCAVQFIASNINDFGAAKPSDPDAVLVCDAIRLVVNGSAENFGDYRISDLQASNEHVTA